VKHRRKLLLEHGIDYRDASRIVHSNPENEVNPESGRFPTAQVVYGVPCTDLCSSFLHHNKCIAGVNTQAHDGSAIDKEVADPPMDTLPGPRAAAPSHRRRRAAAVDLACHHVPPHFSGGELPVVRIGSAVRVRAFELDLWVAGIGNTAAKDR